MGELSITIIRVTALIVQGPICVQDLLQAVGLARPGLLAAVPLAQHGSGAHPSWLQQHAVDSRA